MKPTPESLAALRESADMLAAVCDRAAKCDHLEARNKALQENNDGLRVRHNALQAIIRKAREGLGNVIPECRHMSLSELVTEAAGRIQNLRYAAESFTATAPKVEIDTLVRENQRMQAEIDALRADSPAVREIVRRLNAKGMTVVEAAKTINETFDELAEARAENGRQAATITELLYAEVKPATAPVVIYMGQVFPLRAFETMEQAITRVTTVDPASPHP